MDANVNPAPDQPGHTSEVVAVKSWLRENAFSLVVTAVVCALVFIYLDPIDTAKVVLGLGFIIFIHELGHFLAAKWCDVHVSTFSIGFGPAVPFCSYKWGETTYMVGVIPLGGYVQMVGQADGPESENDGDADDDPRSFRRKTVGQRMFIISAGVVMNIILGMICFMGAYMHGVQEKPATLGGVETGGAAWRAGVRTDSDIRQINSRANPVFNDLRPIVMSTQKGETVALDIEYRGEKSKVHVEPLRDEGSYYPQLGIVSPSKLTLLSLKKKGFSPVQPGTPAAALPKDNGFQMGDRIVAMSDPDKYPDVTTIPLDSRDPDQKQPDYAVYHRRMVLLADKPITFHVIRKGKPDTEPVVALTVEPAYRADLGMRMQMGEVIALRKGGPAEKVGVVARGTDTPPSPGDKIAAVGVTTSGGRKMWFASGKRPDEAKPEDAVEPLDPILLPLQLTRWASQNPPDRKVELVVLREVEHTPKRVTVALDFDDSFRFDRELVTLPNSPLPLSGLGLAYHVGAVVNEVVPGGPAAAAGVQADDVITNVRFKATDLSGTVKAGDWNDVKPNQWASAEAAFQSRPPFEIDLKVKRGDETREVTITAVPDKNWPADDRGLVFQSDFRTQKATDMGDALNLGARRTVRFVREVYLNLYSMIFGRVSGKTLSGPLTIATVSYRFAGEDFWQFLLFLGMISVNLAVVNFLPIPVLDGGHMVFLILEKILGRPVPEKFMALAMYIGLGFILILMISVITLDVRRIFFGWF